MDRRMSDETITKKVKEKLVGVTTNVEALREYCMDWYDRIEPLDVEESSNAKEWMTLFRVMHGILECDKEERLKDLKALDERIQHMNRQLVNIAVYLTNEEDNEVTEECIRLGEKFANENQ
tara:strand:+ start:249 stop:611 length:363 start_codon:yes stop_codon:yes gene_type:complete